MRSLGQHISRRPRLITLIWVVATVIAFAISVGGVGSDGLFARLSGGIPSIPGAESQIAADLLAEESPEGDAIALATHGMDHADPQLAKIMAETTASLVAIPGVATVVDPTALPDGIENPVAAPLLAQDGTGLLLIATLAPDLEDDTVESATRDVVKTLNGAR